MVWLRVIQEDIEEIRLEVGIHPRSASETIQASEIARERHYLHRPQKMPMPYEWQARGEKYECDRPESQDESSRLRARLLRPYTPMPAPARLSEAHSETAGNRSGDEMVGEGDGRVKERERIRKLERGVIVKNSIGKK